MTHRDDNDKRVKNPIEENLERQFQQLDKNIKAPKELKKEVFKTLDTFALVGDVFDLFTAKFSESKAKFMDVISNPNRGNETNIPKRNDGIRHDPASEK